MYGDHERVVAKLTKIKSIEANAINNKLHTLLKRTEYNRRDSLRKTEIKALMLDSSFRSTSTKEPNSNQGPSSPLVRELATRHINRMSKTFPPGPSVRRVPDGDDRERLICPDCGFVSYENPKVVVGSVALWNDTILMCRRAIPPRIGFWTLPAGYLETGETTEAGAVREAWEEARAQIKINTLLAVYNIPRISQVQLIYRAKLRSAAIESGPESLEVDLFPWDEIPWNDIAFPSVVWALRQYNETREAVSFQPYTNPPGETGNY